MLLKSSTMNLRLCYWLYLFIIFMNSKPNLLDSNSIFLSFDSFVKSDSAVIKMIGETCGATFGLKVFGWWTVVGRLCSNELIWRVHGMCLYDMLRCLRAATNLYYRKWWQFLPCYFYLAASCLASYWSQEKNFDGCHQWKTLYRQWLLISLIRCVSYLWHVMHQHNFGWKYVNKTCCQSLFRQLLHLMFENLHFA